MMRNRILKWYHTRLSMSVNWRIKRYLDGLNKTRFKVQHRGLIGIWRTYKEYPDWSWGDEWKHTVWYQSSDKALEKVESDIAYHKREATRLNIVVDIVTFEENKNK